MKETIRDHLWLWCHPAGAHTRRLDQYGLPGTSAIAPADAARFLGISNILMVRYDEEPTPPFTEHALPLAAFDRVVWSVEGGAGGDVDAVLQLGSVLPNLCGVILDDYFARVTATARVGAQGARPPGMVDGAFSLEALRGLRERLVVGDRRLDVWVVLYAHELSQETVFRPHLGLCDVVTFWTWRVEELTDLEDHFARFEQVVGPRRKLLGIYLWDYEGKRAMPRDALERQAALARRWLGEGRIEGLIFLASCLCDLGLESVAWAKAWIAAHAAEPV
jgi:hypothetical protein